MTRPSLRHLLRATALVCLLGFALLSLTDAHPTEPEATAVPKPPTNLSPVISDGEELVYEARWWPFQLGQIRIRTRLKTLPEGGVRPIALAYIDSYGNLPFVDLHTVTETEMDSSLSTVSAKSIEKRGNEWWVLYHYIDQTSKKLIIKDTWQKGKETAPYKPPILDTLEVTGQLQDGLSILFFTRSHLHSNTSVRFPTVVYKKLGNTSLHFTGEQSTTDIDAYDHPIAVKEFTGTAEFEGLFGLSGDFEGWFSDDEAAVPIKAKLGVIIGKIDIELIEWKRQGWVPPQSKD